MGKEDETIDYCVDFNNTSTVLELRQKTGLTQKRFAAYFDLSVRTLQEWEQGKRVPPDYLLKLMKRVLEAEADKPEESSEVKSTEEEKPKT